MAMYQGKSTRGRDQHCIGLPSTLSSLYTPTRTRTRERALLYRREKIYIRENERERETQWKRERERTVGYVVVSQHPEILRATTSRFRDGNPHIGATDYR